MTHATPLAIPEVGPAGEMPAGHPARPLPRQGRRGVLALVARFPGMPLFPGHPPFQVSMHRSPRGIKASGAQPWGPPNEVGLGYMAEVVSATSHSGAHIDALAHMTIGDDNHWFGGATSDEFLTDAGPPIGDASKLPAFFTRGVLLDVPGTSEHRLVCRPARPYQAMSWMPSHLRREPVRPLGRGHCPDGLFESLAG